MTSAAFDLNLLFAFRALVDEESVERAARKLNLSPSAMSRTLGRIRDVFGDPVLVRAGKRMVPTDKAKSLRPSVEKILADVALLAGEGIVSERVQRTFTISANDGFIETFAARIITEFAIGWPHIRFRFSPKHEKDVSPLRNGDVDLEIGVLGSTGPEIIKKSLFKDRIVGVCRAEHPLSKGRISIDRYISYPHIHVSRKGLFDGPIDETLAQHGLLRNVVAVVPTIRACIELATSSDWIAHVPEKHTVHSRKGFFTFALPLATPSVTISILWHPRQNEDFVHKALRDLVWRVCREQRMTARSNH